jgi:hypothetical protein
MCGAGCVKAAPAGAAVVIDGQFRQSARLVARRDDRVGDNSYFVMAGHVTKTYHRWEVTDDARVYGRVLDFVRVEFGNIVHRLAKIELYGSGRADVASGGALPWVGTRAPPFVGYVECSDIGQVVGLCPRFTFEGADIIRIDKEKRLVLGTAIKIK